ncbi:MAG: ferritin family protein [Chloroflexota bacterium]
MERFSIVEVIEQAIQTERLGYQFYTDMAEKFKEDRALGSLFTTLAEKEQRHEKAFRDLKEMVGDSELEGWEEVSHYMRAIAESEFFLGKNKSLPSMEGIRSIADAVAFAIGFEKETLLYFLGVRDAVKEKDVVDEIVNEEKSHIRWLAAFKAGLAKA